MATLSKLYFKARTRVEFAAAAAFNLGDRVVAERKGTAFPKYANGTITGVQGKAYIVTLDNNLGDETFTAGKLTLISRGEIPPAAQEPVPAPVTRTPRTRAPRPPKPEPVAEPVTRAPRTRRVNQPAPQPVTEIPDNDTLTHDLPPSGTGQKQTKTTKTAIVFNDAADFINRFIAEGRTRSPVFFDRMRKPAKGKFGKLTGIEIGDKISWDHYDSGKDELALGRYMAEIALTLIASGDYTHTGDYEQLIPGKWLIGQVNLTKTINDGNPLFISLLCREVNTKRGTWLQWSVRAYSNNGADAIDTVGLSAATQARSSRASRSSFKGRIDRLTGLTGGSFPLRDRGVARLTFPMGREFTEFSSFEDTVKRLTATGLPSLAENKTPTMSSGVWVLQNTLDISDAENMALSEDINTYLSDAADNISRDIPGVEIKSGRVGSDHVELVRKHTDEFLQMWDKHYYAEYRLNVPEELSIEIISEYSGQDYHWEIRVSSPITHHQAARQAAKMGQPQNLPDTGGKPLDLAGIRNAFVLIKDVKINKITKAIRDMDVNDGDGFMANISYIMDAAQSRLRLPRYKDTPFNGKPAIRGVIPIDVSLNQAASMAWIIGELANTIKTSGEFTVDISKGEIDRSFMSGLIKFAHKRAGFTVVLIYGVTPGEDCKWATIVQ
jgi:hypothetical protein